MTSYQPIRLGNKDFRLERVKVPIDFLRLDPSNQRISYVLQKRGGSSTDSDLHAVLWEMDPVKQLYTSILQNGGLISDPIVKADGLVVEGNCRTVCLRQLKSRYPDDPRWRELYVQMLQDDATDEQITMLIGELHIAGKIEWRAFEQAEYVWKMNELFGKSIDYLASHLRRSRAQVVQKIAAYQETRLYIEETGDVDGINRFSHFEELMKKKELRELRENDSQFASSFRQWVRDGKFPDSRDVRQLPQILENETAFAAFQDGGLPAARKILSAHDPSLVSNFWATIDRATSELRTIPLVELEDLQKGAPSKVEKLRLLKKAIDTLVQHAQVEL
jgi:hypothetical protein